MYKHTAIFRPARDGPTVLGPAREEYVGIFEKWIIGGEEGA